MIDSVAPTVFVPYCRVSTGKQKRSGLGLEAQRAAIEDYVRSVGGSLTGGWFVEAESGRRRDRPELGKALALARRHSAVLLVAKLDRLGRNVAFVSALMESRVQFRAADFPQADALLLHVLSAVGEYESRACSRRTKEALAAARARGVILGKPENLLRGNAPANERARDEARLVAERLRPVVAGLRAAGVVGVVALCRELAARGFTTPGGAPWYPGTLSRALRRL